MKGFCNICGQRLTDASGSWKVTFNYTGIMERPSFKFRCCSACEDLIDKSIVKLSRDRTKQREKEGWGR